MFDAGAGAPLLFLHGCDGFDPAQRYAAELCRQARLLADLAEVGAELVALLTQGAGALDQVQGLLDELVCPGGLLGPGAGQVSHAVASFHRATLPSPSTYQVGRRFGRWPIGCLFLPPHCHPGFPLHRRPRRVLMSR